MAGELVLFDGPSADAAILGTPTYVRIERQVLINGETAMMHWKCPVALLKHGIGAALGIMQDAMAVDLQRLCEQRYGPGQFERIKENEFKWIRGEAK